MQWLCTAGVVSTVSPTSAPLTRLYTLPPLPNINWCAAQGSTGSGVILPLTPKTAGGYVVEYAMFGGHQSRDNTVPDPGNPAVLVKWGESCVRAANPLPLLLAC